MMRLLIALPILCSVIAAGCLFSWTRGEAANGSWIPFSGPGAGSLTLACNTNVPDGFVATLKKALPEEGGPDVQALNASGSQEKLQLLRDSRADVALMRSGLGLDYGSVGAVAAIGTDLVHLIVPADSPLTTFRELVGHRIGVGTPDGDADLLARRVFSYLHFDDAPLLVSNHEADLQSAFASGEIDAAFLVEPLLSPGVDELLGTGYYRLLPVPEAEAIARVLSGVVATTVPSNIYGPERALPLASAGAFPALGVHAFLVAGPSVQSEPLEALLALLLSVPADDSLGVVQISLPAQGYQGGIATHPAVQRYLRKGAPVSRDDLQEFASMLAGVGFLILGAAQCIILWNRYLERRGRRDMVKWFELVQDIGARMEVADTPQELGRLLDELASKQRLIERGWITGKIGATELLLLTQAHQARVSDAIAKHGAGTTTVMESNSAPAKSYASFTASFVPQPNDEPERSETVVRPDFGEALVSTVRVRKRETATPETAEPEPAPASHFPLPPAPGPVAVREEQSRSDAERWASEQPSIIQARTEWANRSHSRPAVESEETDDVAVDGEEDAQETRLARRRRRGGRGRRQRQTSDEQPAPQPMPTPLQPPSAPGEDDEQLDLFGRRG